jgi:hypothetical protein
MRKRRIEVDSQMLAEGMKITFFGISTIFASMGIPEEAVKFLGIREPGKESLERNESPQSDQNPEVERPVPYATDAEDDRPQVSASKDIESRNTRLQGAGLQEAGLQEAGPKNAESHNAAPKNVGQQPDAESPQITLDEIIRVIKRKIQDDPENSDRIRAILNNKYQKEKVQELTEESYETFLKEIRAL